MAAFKTLRTLIRKNPNPRSLASPFTHHHSTIPHRNPNPRLSSPLFGPSPPWILFHSAAPLYLRGKDGFFLGDPIRPGSLGLGFGYATEAGSSVGEKRKESGDGREKEVDGFLNLPNMVSMSRMISGPVIGWMIMNQMYLPSFFGLAISGATDWLDGFLARRMGINSVYGSYLDPLADKVLIGSVALAMVERDLLHPGLVGLVVFRDVGLVCGAIYRRGSILGWKWKSWSDFFNLDAAHREKVEPLFISKVNTVLQLLLVGTALLQPEFGSEGTQLYITYLSWLVASTTIASSAAYGVWYLRRQTMAS